MQGLPDILKCHNLQSLNKALDLLIEFKFCESDFYFLNKSKNCMVATFNFGSVYVGQTIMRWLHVASSNCCLMHAFEVATNESTDEPAHWHSLTRAHTLCINKVWKYIHVRPALLDGYVRNVF